MSSSTAPTSAEDGNGTTPRPTSLPTSLAPTLEPTLLPSTLPPTPPTLKPTTARPSTSPTIPLLRPHILGYQGDAVYEFEGGVQGIQIKLDEKLPATSCEFYSPPRPEDEGDEATWTTFFTLVQDVPPFAYVNHQPDNAASLLASSEFPFRLDNATGNVTGIAPSSLSDLTLYALTCISYSSQIPRQANWTARYNPIANDVFLDGGDYPSHGGNEIIANNTVLAQTCPIFWLGVNVITQAYENNAITNAFHLVRNADTDFMTFPDNPHYSSYFANLIVGAIPFWAITLLCIFLYPSVWCVRLYLGLKHTASATTGNLSKMTSCPSSFLRCCCGPCCNRDASTDTASATAAADKANEPLMRRNRAEEYRKEIRAILSPQPIRLRLCYLVMGIFVFLCILTVGLAAAVANEGEDAVINPKLTVMESANTRSLELLAALNSTYLTALDNASRFPNASSYLPSLQANLYNEMLSVAQYAILSNPSNLRPLQMASTLLYPEVTILVEVVVFALLMIAPILIVWAVVLSSCTFRYEERVKCGGVSRCIGSGLRCYMIFCATMCWGVVMFYFYTVSMSADICFYPSVYYMPLANSTQLSQTRQPFFEPDSLQVFTPDSKQFGFYDASSNNYRFEGVNTAEFYFDCNYLSAPEGNPFVSSMILAERINRESIALARQNADLLTVQSLEQSARAIQNLAVQMRCGNFIAARAITLNVCERAIIANFITFFFLMVIGTTLMVFIPCARWVHPNMYRQMLANRVFDRVQRERARKIKQIASKDYKLGKNSPSAAEANANSDKGAEMRGEESYSMRSPHALLRRASAILSFTSSTNSKHKVDEDEFDARQSHGNSSSKIMDYTFNADVQHV